MRKALWLLIKVWLLATGRERSAAMAQQPPELSREPYPARVKSPQFRADMILTMTGNWLRTMRSPYGTEARGQQLYGKA